MAETARLLISCPDRPGIVAAVSGFLFRHGANIVSSDQHSTDPEGGRFFMRMEFSDVGLGAGAGASSTPRVVLRALAPGDEPELRRILATPEVARWWDEPEPGFPWTDLDPDTMRLAVEVGGELAGMVQYSEESDPKYRHASIDLFLDPAIHGRGVGTEVVRRVVRHLISDRGHHRITIDPAASNRAAIRAYEKVGFRPVGVMHRYERDVGGGGWHDGLLMELVVDERSA